MGKAASFIQGKEGLNYKDGKLFLFEKNRVIVMKIDKYGPVAWEKTEENPKFSFTIFPNIGWGAAKHIVSPPEDDKYIHWRDREIMKFMKENIPYHIIELMAPFLHEKWIICSLAMRTGCDELIRSNPALAYIVALNNVFIGRCAKPWRRARSLVSKKRTDILRKAGFPPTESTVKILAKIPPYDVNIQTVFIIRTLLNRNDRKILKILRNLPVISAGICRNLLNREKSQILGFPVFQKIAEESLGPIHWSITETLQLMIDVFRIHRMYNFRIPQRIQTPEHLEKVHDDYVNLINEIDAGRLAGWYIGDTDSKYADAVFPKQPLENFTSSDFSIEYIQNGKELAKWGVKQHNCVASYAPKVARGLCHIYKITKPEEATLEITHQGKKWIINQLRAEYNAPVTELTSKMVELWISKAFQNNNFNQEKFPFKKFKEGNIHFEPLTSISTISKINFSRFKTVSFKNVVIDCTTFIYRLLSPEKGIIGLKQINGQWEIIMAETDNNEDLQLSTFNILEDWLWEKTAHGELRQMKLPFSTTL